VEADEGNPEAFIGQVLMMFAAWVADQELEAIKRRTTDGLERARQRGKTLGRPRRIGDRQVAAMKRMREGGATHRQIAKAFQCSTSSVGRALQQEGVTP
jgi:DNA invertase Pin-like site-specific DNA recombinase